MSGCHGNGAQEKGKTVLRGAGGERIGEGTHGRASGGEAGSTQEEGSGKAQSYAQQTAGRRRIKRCQAKDVSGSQLKVAVTFVLAFSTTVHVSPTKELQFVQVTFDAPAPGVAVSPIVLPSGKSAEQVPGHLRAWVESITLPDPTISTVRTAWLQPAVPAPPPVRNAEPVTWFG